MSVNSAKPLNVAPLLKLCEKAVKGHVFPGAAFAVGTSSEVAFGAAGRLRYAKNAPKVTPETIYDLASVTKVMATTTAAMLLYDDGHLDLDKRAQEYVPAFKGAGKENVTVRNLLLHNAGLPAYARYEKDSLSSEEVRKRVLEEPLEAKPGEKTVYSCISAISLQAVIESISGKSLDVLAQERVFQPLGLVSTRFNPPTEWKDRIAPTEKPQEWHFKFRPADWRPGEWLQGDVHDPISFMVGGVSGNAGLFSNAKEVATFLQMILRGGMGPTGQIVCAKTVTDWTKKQTTKSTRALGWDTKAPEESSAGRFFSTRSFGHTGYTGTSVWVDPEHGCFAVLLSNRVHPKDTNTKIVKFRPVFHDAVAKVLGFAE